MKETSLSTKQKAHIKLALNLIFLLFLFIFLNIAFQKYINIRWTGPDATFIESKKEIAWADFFQIYENSLKNSFFNGSSNSLTNFLKEKKGKAAMAGINLIPEQKGHAERTLLWYIFIHKDSVSNFNFLASYSYKESLSLLDKVWGAISSLSSQKIEDPNLLKKRFSAFNNLTLEYIRNEYLLFYNPENKQLNKETYYTDPAAAKKIYKLFDDLVRLHAYYKEFFPDYYLTHQKEVTYSIIVNMVTKRMLYYELTTGNFSDNFCSRDKNRYLDFYLGSRKYIKETASTTEIPLKEGLDSVIDPDLDIKLDAECGATIDR